MTSTVQLVELAQARSELQGGTVEQHLELFRRHGGTPEACVRGHPEIALAVQMARRDEHVLCITYLCPACGQAPVEWFL